MSKSKEIELTSGTLINRRDLANDPDEIQAREKLIRFVGEQKIAEEKAIRDMFARKEPTFPSFLIRAFKLITQKRAAS